MAAAAGVPVSQRVEECYAARRRHSALTLLAVTAAAAVSFHVSEMDFRNLAAGLPGAWQYVAGTLPELRLTSLCCLLKRLAAIAYGSWLGTIATRPVITPPAKAGPLFPANRINCN